MRDEEKQAWSFLQGMTTQIVTLAAGTIVFSVTATLFEGVFPIAEATCVQKAILFASWSLLCVSVLFGILVFGRAINLLGKEDKENENEEEEKEGMVYESLMQQFSRIQHLTFYVGVLLFVFYAALNISK